MANNRHILEESPNTISVNHTNSGLSRRSIAQRARRERERQLREHALFNQDLPNHPFESVAHNLNDVLNREATQTEPANPHAHNNVTETEILPPFGLGGITMNTPNLMNHVRNNNSELSNRSIVQRARRERERQLRELASIEALVPEDAAESFVQNEVPIPINPTIVLAFNFPSSTFEIGESSSVPQTFVSHMIFQTKLPPDYETSRTADINIQAIGYQSFLIVSDPSIAKHIFRENSKAYSKGILAEILEFVMGKGLIPADGEIWRVRRRPIVPALHKKSCRLDMWTLNHAVFILCK
ncbi:hypothetical protein GIB67_000020 [Kingdonia uniflora]|uniref:Cytochrome P450 n=1 Tax=Kingdonia uniflora TaxID=39325 RepID=A0A7J7MNM2_9MAGN|nr:hypothetical protein GIB67_000020 [Kingdonia uniflora]